MTPSILDNDLYSYSVGAAVLEHYAGTPVAYRFQNRRPSHDFDDYFLNNLRWRISKAAAVSITSDELAWLRQAAPFIPEWYFSWLKNFKLDASQVETSLVDGELKLEVRGPWESAIFWEVPLLAMISEAYFQQREDRWKTCVRDYRINTLTKARYLTPYKFADFGTRRRRAYDVQSLVVESLATEPNFVGTSNCYFAKLFGVKPIGTMSHQWIMGVSALEGLRHANRFAMKRWSETYKGLLGVALTDTFGSGAFFEDFDPFYANLFTGVRQDSGDPMEFAEKAISHYKKLGIDPNTKTIVFSDGLTVESARAIGQKLEGRIRFSFGIGTSLTNDFNDPALNIVIKMHECAGVPVVKLSDIQTKQMGDRDALRVANWTFNRIPLDGT